MAKKIKIEGVHIDLDALKASAPKDLKKTDLFVHLPQAKQDAAYQALQKELDGHKLEVPEIKVEKEENSAATKAPANKVDGSLKEVK